MENFPNNFKCRLINPAKSQIGIVSKQISEKINNTIRLQSSFNEWRNTSSITSWFRSIPNKSERKFLKFYTVDFYPTNSEHILRADIIFVKSYVDIKDSVIYTILHSRKSLLFTTDSVWIIHSGSMFDVTTESYDGAKIRELLGLFLLDKPSSTIHAENIGLSPDDDLAIIREPPGLETYQEKGTVLKSRPIPPYSDQIFWTHPFTLTPESLGHTANPTTRLFTSIPDLTILLPITKQLPRMINNR